MTAKDIRSYLAGQFPIEPGSGYVISKRLCIMESRKGWGLYARTYTDAENGDLCDPDNEQAEESDPMILEALPNVEAVKALQEFLRLSNGEPMQIRSEKTDEKNEGGYHPIWCPRGNSEGI